MGAAPTANERTCKTLEEERMRRFPVQNPEWTDFNQSDPGIGLVQLFAFLVETLVWLTDERQRQRRRRRVRRLAVVVVGAAGVGFVVWRMTKDSSA